jgi:hypothetical protein
VVLVDGVRCRSEIQKMLVLNVKVEIEILSNSILKEWINKRISEMMNC